ncbi:hypothetical protein BC830DRAFT_827171 [Chytriomyces sp. MP71]|nr:hypothetical protein BC830DRAFT_827171 [Chytriomyces sp. MP71]
MSRRRTRLLLTVLAVAGLLWLLLLAESVPRASVDPLRVRHFRDKYRAAYAKDPPRNHEKWVSFAHERKCLADPSLYFQVMRDLDPWLRRGRIDPRSLATFWAARTGTFANGHFEFRTATRNAPQFYADTFHDIAHLLPETKNFTFLINLLDEPRIVPSQSRDGPYTSMEDVFLHNGCFRRKYAVPSSIASDYYNPHLRAIAGDASIRSQHSFLLSPTTFALENFLAPVFSQSKLDDCTNDVLVPLQYHHFFANASHTHDPIPWEDKKPVAFWRGTSTGGKLSKTSQWRQYGRFRMMDWEREWAKRHPGATFDASREELPSPKNLSIDFGFNKARLVSSDAYPMTPLSFLPFTVCPSR